MARVRTFKIDDIWGVPDSSIAEFITECEKAHYVNVTMLYASYVPQTPENMKRPVEDRIVENRITVVVTKLDVKEQIEADRDLAEAKSMLPPPREEKLIRRKPNELRHVIR